MSSALPASKAQIIIGLCIPLAVLIGYFLAEPNQLGSVTLLFAVMGVLIFPMFMRWHHPLLVLAWNSTLAPAFLPGNPQLWMLIAFASLFVVILNRTVSDRHPIRHVTSVSMPLLALLFVVVVTGIMTGGFGFRALGSGTYGGRHYVFIAAAAAGYLALSSQRVDPQRHQLYVAMFFLPGLIALLSNLAFAGGQGFWWLFYILPAKFVGEQLTGEYALNAQIIRFSGLTVASSALYFWIMARWGIRGLFVLRRPWRMAVYVLAWAGCLFCGFRSILGMFMLVFVFQFLLEGLHKSRLMPVALGALLVLGTIVLVDAEKLPMVVQRTLSILPVKVSNVARVSAETSTEWRFDMWRSVLPEVPRYLLKGKGYAIDPNDLQMAIESSTRGIGGRYATAETAGDYHNGPLSVVITFGLWGVLAFCWFLAACVRYLYSHYRWGDPQLHRINTFLLTLFLSKAVYFVLIFGTFDADLAMFAGLVGFSAALNGVEVHRRQPRAGVWTQDAAVEAAA